MESSLENKCMSHKVARKFILYPSELRTACDSVTPLVTPRFNNRFIFSPTTGHRRCKALIMCSLAPHTSDFGVRFDIQHIEMTFFTNSLTTTWNETDPDTMQRVSHSSVWKMHLASLEFYSLRAIFAMNANFGLNCFFSKRMCILSILPNYYPPLCEAWLFSLIPSQQLEMKLILIQCRGFLIPLCERCIKTSL